MEDAINSDELPCPLLDVRHHMVVPVACDYELVVVFWFLELRARDPRSTVVAIPFLFFWLLGIAQPF